MNRRAFLKGVAVSAAAGAAFACRAGVTPRRLDASALVATLREQKAFLG